jgi:multiple antibiotic resistance protein
LDFVADLVRAIIALFIIVDPFGNIPIFVGLTQNIPRAKIRKVYDTAVLVGMILLLVFAFAGTAILTAFGLSLQSFEIAGGILLLIIAVRIVISGTHESVESPESIGAVPIAIPLLVGPGAITTTMVTFQTYSKTDGLAIALSIAVLAVVIVMSLTWVILRFINQIDKVLGKTGAIVIARVMALLIAGIAIQYILTGINTFPFAH